MNAFFEKHKASLINVGYEQADASSGQEDLYEESVDADEAIRIHIERWPDVKNEWFALEISEMQEVIELTREAFLKEWPFDEEAYA